jgi:hypothetical protein
MDYTLVGTPVARTLSLQGAPMRWKSESGKNDLYVPDIRIVGTERAVRAWMMERNIDGSLLERAFRAGDQTGQRYKDAVKAGRTPRTPRASAARPAPVALGRLKSPLRMVRQFNARIDVGQPIKLRDQRNEEKTSPCKTSLLKRVPVGEEDTTEDKVLGAPMVSHKHIAALKKRMASLPPHKVLDISTYDPSTGKGARLIAKPNARDLTRRGLPDIPLVSRTGEPLRVILGLLEMQDQVANVTW